MKKDFVELSKEWFNKQAPVYDETNTILYSKYGKISCENIFEFLKEYKKLSDTGVGPFKMFGVKVDDFIYRHFSNTGDCNVSYMEKTKKDMERNGFMIEKNEKITTFIYTVVGKKI